MGTLTMNPPCSGHLSDTKTQEETQPRNYSLNIESMLYINRSKNKRGYTKHGKENRNENNHNSPGDDFHQDIPCAGNEIDEVWRNKEAIRRHGMLRLDKRVSTQPPKVMHRGGWKMLLFLVSDEHETTDCSEEHGGHKEKPRIVNLFDSLLMCL